MHVAPNQRNTAQFANKFHVNYASIIIFSKTILSHIITRNLYKFNK